MKKLITCMVLLIPVISVKTEVKAAILTAVANGSWNDPAIWDSGATPICGDTIIVPLALVVRITANVDLNDPGDPLCPSVRITVGGNLLFNAGKKMRLADGACITVDFGGSLTHSLKGGGASEGVVIGNDDFWKSSDGILNGYAASPCGVLLPVQLIQFSVVAVERGADLNWLVGTVTDLDYYFIEKSEDGQNWIYLAKIDFSDYSMDTKDFSYMDENYNSYKTTYYRLTSVDFSGIHAVLDTEVLLESASLENGNMVVIPNPASANEFVILHFDVNLDQEVELLIANQLGQIVFQQKIKLAPEQRSYTLESNLLNKGHYYVSVNTENKQLKSKLTLL